MSAHSTPAEPPTDPGPYATDARHHREVLNDLIDMGADLARLLHKQAMAVGWVSEAPPTTAPRPASPEHHNPTPDLTLAFDRVARCVRRTVLLARRIAEPLPVPAEHRAAQTAAELRVAARKRIIRDVEDAIARAAQSAPKADKAADALHAELHDRLDAPELDDDIRHRSIPDIIADICRDLGIAAAGGAKPWKRRTPADIEALCVRAAAPAGVPRPAPPGAIPVTPAAAKPPRPPPPAVSRTAASVATLLRYAARPP